MMTTHVTVNGEAVVLDAPTSIQELVARVMSERNESETATERGGIAVAVNNDVIPRGSWSTTPVRAGDRVEILTATQGG
ncbi:sulfur carrier protein ThiS [Actinobacteria bacterium YIM 96077]|uniref:Thiamine biosynthesis protein ThiS n=1 Tax=Phytoactinopolyspora halophila TaxID=1981511 RepID=A0A329QZY2_9ACTN|nr:sulfur carrier protein ThiS [Phytoactinopolyspora halophila]AYY11634.1 sulfur carrier protein ThiS [Actinobacteria bacterium YIM 96077]RAW17934.1 thiamine biosynthesis protein ThiS [Phytoactinopolyspora halophila]